MENKKASISGKLKTLAKLCLTLGALYLVSRKISPEELWSLVQKLNFLWLIPAVGFFVLSKVATSVRLNLYFKDIGLHLSEKSNWKLYLRGMFYNLFLPGGIGGDGYKVYLINKNFGASVKSLLKTVFLDRFGGMVAIFFLLFGFFLIVDINLEYLESNLFNSLMVLGLVITLPSFWVIQKLWFKEFLPSFWKANAWSFAGQIFQLICAWFILKSLGVEENFLAYQLVFLISSLVAVLPLTIGGVGARELVFVYAHTYAGIEENTAVAFSLLFFLITAGVSLIGSWTKVDLNGVEKN